MASRTIYSCDWCRVDSPEPNSKGMMHGWRHLENELICGDCAQAISDAIHATRVARSTPNESNATEDQ